jgi:AraC family transcriptional activator of pobA
LIEKHYGSQRSVSFYAKSLHTHPYHLNFLVKQYTGLTAKESITKHIVLEAKVLLASTSLTIKEISFKLGFDHPEHFSSTFKNGKDISHAIPAQASLISSFFPLYCSFPME